MQLCDEENFTDMRDLAGIFLAAVRILTIDGNILTLLFLSRMSEVLVITEGPLLIC